VVRLEGRDHYLGPYDSPESHAEYRRLVAEWLADEKAISPTQPGVEAVSPPPSMS
jgi:hypothetical protein